MSGPIGTQHPVQTRIRYEPRRKGGRTVLRPEVSWVKFLSNDGVLMTIWLPDVDLQTGGIFTFPSGLHDVGDKRIAGDPLATLPMRLGHLLGQSATPLYLYTEFVAHIYELPDHEGDGPVLDIVAEQQAHVAMQTMQSQGPQAPNGPAGPLASPVSPFRSVASFEQQRRAFEELLKQQQLAAADGPAHVEGTR